MDRWCRVRKAKCVTDNPFVTFVVTDSLEPPASAQIIARAAELGLGLTPESSDHEHIDSFRVEGDMLRGVVQMRAPIPDFENYPTSVFSPPLEQLQAARSHLILTTVGLPSDPVMRRTLQAVLCAAVVSATQAIAVGLGHGWYAASVLDSLAEGASRDASPSGLLLVDITCVTEPSGATSFLTSGMDRAGREEELFLTCPQRTKTERDWVFDLVNMLVADPTYNFPPTGHTVGRDANERILVKREPNPTGSGLPVVRLDLPA